MELNSLKRMIPITKPTLPNYEKIGDKFKEVINSGMITNSKYVKEIESSEIETNKFNLSTNKYVLSADIQSINKKLEGNPTVSLGRLIKVIRPRVHRVGVDSGLEALEIGAIDIPNRGFIDNPSKAVFLGDVMPNDNYAKPNDIVLVVIGLIHF